LASNRHGGIFTGNVAEDGLSFLHVRGVHWLILLDLKTKVQIQEKKLKTKNTISNKKLSNSVF
jgi:hypothetical protein